MLREVFILSALQQHADCHSITKYYDAWIEDGHVYIQLEWCPLGSLSAMLSKGIIFQEPTILQICLQVAQGLACLHSFGVAHLDIKPDNILQIAEGHFKICDFGLVTTLKDSPQSIESEGDKRYLPSEALEDKLSNLDKIDMFSLGVTLYELAMGKPLGNSSEVEQEKIRHGDISLLPVMSPFLFELIRSLLHNDPLKRKSANEIVQLVQMYTDPLHLRLRQLEQELALLKQKPGHFD